MRIGSLLFSSSERISVALRLSVVTSSVRMSDTIVSLKGKGKLMADHTDYRAEVAEFYDHVVEVREREDVDFFVDQARESGGPLLELGCGTGRVLIPTAKAGIEIVGLDLSVSMLEQCRKRLASEAHGVGSASSLSRAT